MASVAFIVGTISLHVIFEPTTLEEITANTSHFEGRLVQFETYAQVEFGTEIQLGQPFEKPEAPTCIRSGSGLEPLRKTLAQNSTENEYNRIKVIARGFIYDNCSHGITCCFGRSMELSNAEIIPTGPIERYHPPLQPQSQH